MSVGPSQHIAISEYKYTPLGYEQITGLSAVKGLTVPAGAKFALICPTGAAVRWRDDGTDPTATIGMHLTTGQAFWYQADLSAIKFIEEGTSAILDVTYYTW